MPAPTPKFKLKFSSRFPDGVAESAKAAAAAMNAEFEQIAADRNLSDTGRKAKLTEAAKVHVFDANARVKAVRSARKAIDAKAGQLHQERKPLAATESERREALMVWEKADRAAERGNLEEASRLRRIFDTKDPDAATYRLQVAFSTIHPALVGAIGERYQQTAASRLGLTDDFGPELETLADEAETLAAEEEQLRDLRAQMIQASDRATLEAAGFIPKKPTQWSSDERRKFIDEHGVAAHRELLDDELREAAGVPARFDSSKFEAPGPEAAAVDPAAPSMTFIPA